MKSFRDRFQHWINEIQTRLGVTSLSLQSAKHSIDGAREVFRLSTHHFTDEQMPAVEQIEKSLDTSAATIHDLLQEIEELRAALDRLLAAPGKD